MNMAQTDMENKPEARVPDEINDCLTLAPAAALCVMDLEDTPVMRLFREWQIAFKRMETGTFPSDEEFSVENNKVNDLVARLIRTKATNAHDVCAKLTAFTGNGEYFADDGRRLSGLLMADARALVSGEGGGDGQ